MKIEHIALYVTDLEGARQFFETYFAAQANQKYHNPKTGLQTYFLSFEDGARLEIMARPEAVNKSEELYHLGFTHIAFSLGSEEAVRDLTTRLKEAGYRVLSGPRTTGDGYFESAILAFEGNQLELTV